VRKWVVVECIVSYHNEGTKHGLCTTKLQVDTTFQSAAVTGWLELSYTVAKLTIVLWLSEQWLLCKLQLVAPSKLYNSSLLCFASWLSECTASHLARSNVEYSHHKVCIFLLCGVQFTLCSLQPDNQPAKHNMLQK
jgi:hypothetical protein